MTNYVISYNFSDASLQSDFIQRVKKTYPKHQEEEAGGMNFLAFAARRQPGVKDDVRHLINSSKVANSDVVALYFSRKDNPDQIKRVLILGTDDVAEQKLQARSKTQHNNLLIDLLGIDFVKQQMSEQK